MFVPRDANLNVLVGAGRAVATKHKYKSVNNNKVTVQIIGKKIVCSSAHLSTPGVQVCVKPKMETWLPQCHFQGLSSPHPKGSALLGWGCVKDPGNEFVVTYTSIQHASASSAASQ